MTTKPCLTRRPDPGESFCLSLIYRLITLDYDFDGTNQGIQTMESQTPSCRSGLFLEHDISVRTYEIDYAGHVSNVAYLYWLEDMRNMLFEKYFPLETFMKDGVGPVLASTFISYKRPIKLFDKPKALMWISEAGTASLTIECEITVNGEPATFARHVGVFVNLASGKPVRLPAICKQTFEQASAATP